MKATPILLPPEVEPYVRRVGIRAGQPEYSVIPAVIVSTPVGGSLKGYLSRWELTSSEKNAVARSELRGMLIAFATWLANQVAKDAELATAIHGPDGDVALGAAVHRFIGAHASQLEGEDAALWYTRLMGEGDGYQPQQMEISTTPPLDVEVIDVPGVILPSTNGQIH